MSDFKALSDTHVLQHQSLDGYLYLRFLKMMAIISFGGCCITWPILFPVNATGGGHQSQLDMLSFGNVLNPKRYWAHAIVSWIYHGFVLYIVTHERVFFIGLRQAYFLSSFHARRLSSRVVLFLSVPENDLHESKLREIFGSDVNKVWMIPDSQALEDLVERRNDAWNKLEKAEVKLIKKSNSRRLKIPDTESAAGNPRQWMVSKDRPTHRLKPLLGEKVDTINHSRSELTSTAPEIKRLRENVFQEGEKLKTAAFVEFSTQLAAQRALQFAAKEKRTAMHPRYIGVLPSEVIWKNIGVSNKSRKTKLALATGIVWLLVIFWAFPIGFVGVLTNVNYLTNKVPFLSFIDNVPPKILGVITGLLPTLLILILMQLVPYFCKGLAKSAGLPTLSTVELQVQNWYFAFQLIQVFLVTTFTSGATAVATQIVADPKSAVTLLAQNLPKASNFYLSYFIYYGLLMAMLQLLNLVPLLTVKLLGKSLDKTPRKLYKRWMTLKGLSWGKVYPKFTLLGVIALSYSCIAPLVLGFATIGFILLYLGFRYNFLFAYGTKIDTKGQSYSRALQHLLSGVYLSIICLIGLFAIGTRGSKNAIGPLVLEVISLIVVIVYQTLLDSSLDPLEEYLPVDLLEENDASITKAIGLEEGRLDDTTEEKFDAEKGGDPFLNGNSIHPMHEKSSDPNQDTTSQFNQQQGNELYTGKHDRWDGVRDGQFANVGRDEMEHTSKARFAKENQTNQENYIESNIFEGTDDEFHDEKEAHQDSDLHHESRHLVPEHRNGDINHKIDRSRRIHDENSDQQSPVLDSVSNPKGEGAVHGSDEEKARFYDIPSDHVHVEHAATLEPQRNTVPKSQDEEGVEQKKKLGFLTRWAKPKIYKSYAANKSLLSGSDAARMVPRYTKHEVDVAYQSPDVTTPLPLVWLAKDRGDVSKMMIEENQKDGIETTDDQAWFDEKNKLDWNRDHPEKAPIHERFVQY